MVEFRIIHHIPGRIRIAIPAAKGLTLKDVECLSDIVLPSSIKNIRVNPLNYNLIIDYDHQNIDILDFLHKMANNDIIRGIINHKNSR